MVLHRLGTLPPRGRDDHYEGCQALGGLPKLLLQPRRGDMDTMCESSVTNSGRWLHIARDFSHRGTFENDIVTTTLR
jgi:hypothetical protein